MIENLVPFHGGVGTTVKVPAAYVLKHIKSGKVYIGSSGMPGLRISRHLTLLRGKRHDNPRLQDAFNDDDKLEWVIYTVESREEAYAHEQALLEYYRDVAFNYGDDVKAPMRGRETSDSAKLKQRLAKLGKRLTAEHIKKVREGMKGVVRTEAQKKHLSNLKKGKPQPEHIQAMNRERNMKRAKAVIIDEVRYDGIRIAARELGVSRDVVKIRMKSPKWPTWQAA